MPNLKPGHLEPTAEEDAIINAGIAADPDADEGDEGWSEPMTVDQAHPKLAEQLKRVRGKQKRPTKEPVTIRLDADIAGHFRATGPGWQSRLNAVLRRAISMEQNPND